MNTDTLQNIFTKDRLAEIFPKDRADLFFDALYGDAGEGAYDISLAFQKYFPGKKELVFEFHLMQRPGKCLACNLTYGLPQVFSRHPIINVKGIVQAIDRMLNGNGRCADWQIGTTREISNRLHIVPLIISLETA